MNISISFQQAWLNFSRKFSISILLIAGLFHSEGAFANQPAIRNMVDEFVEAFSRGDTQAAVDLFTTNAVVMPSNDLDLKGHDAMKNYWAPGFIHNYVDLSVDIQSIETSGNLGFVQMITHAKVTPKKGGETKNHVYRDLIIVKRVGNTWKIHRDLSQQAPLALLQQLAK
ncbi:MAG: YybH family protein [Rhodospirillaceae bacterium]